MPGAHAIKLVAEANDVYATIDKSVNELERAISPYIRFNKALI
jgi:ribosome-associated translation inhibitor RaiA